MTHYSNQETSNKYSSFETYAPCALSSRHFPLNVYILRLHLHLHLSFTNLTVWLKKVTVIGSYVYMVKFACTSIRIGLCLLTSLDFRIKLRITYLIFSNLARYLGDLTRIATNMTKYIRIWSNRMHHDNSGQRSKSSRENENYLPNYCFWYVFVLLKSQTP